MQILISKCQCLNPKVLQRNHYNPESTLKKVYIKIVAINVVKWWNWSKVKALNMITEFTVEFSRIFAEFSFKTKTNFETLKFEFKVVFANSKSNTLKRKRIIILAA